MYDIILKGGKIVDGTRAKSYHANLCIAQGRIAKITTEDIYDGNEVLDVSGLIVSPGFFDMHSHSDSAPLVDYSVEGKLVQGITTELVGNCGTSNLPTTPERHEEVNRWLIETSGVPLLGLDPAVTSVSEYAEKVEAKGSLTNFGALVGHCTLRLAAMGYVNRDPSPEEMETMKALLARELERGAFGMSLGLVYPPSVYSKRSELVELAKVIAKYHGMLTVHMRDEGAGVLASMDEMIDIARESGVHLQISHLKPWGKPQWGLSSTMLQKVDLARAEGIDINCDQYPYLAGSNQLTSVIPPWAHEGGADRMVERLKNREGNICQGVAETLAYKDGPSAILIDNTYGYHPEYEGKFLSQLAEEFGMDPVDTVLKLLIDCHTCVHTVDFCIQEADMLNIMSRTDISVGTDGSALPFDNRIVPYLPHPRNYGTFPRYFSIVREKKLLPIEDAVYKVTGLPAKIMGLSDRGVIREGNAADIVVFDWESIASDAGYLDPKIKPVGVPHVIVNGKFVLKNGELTGKRPGKVLRHGKPSCSHPTV